MDAWRTSCPKLPVWEDANARGLVTRLVRSGAPFVAITPAGQALLAQAKRR
jgi:D-3-phosphoglycerate dehydrogenase